MFRVETVSLLTEMNQQLLNNRLIASGIQYQAKMLQNCSICRCGLSYITINKGIWVWQRCHFGLWEFFTII